MLRAPDGSLQRTAGAAFLGLTLAFAVGCADTGGSTGLQTMSTYGTAASGGDYTSVASSGGMGGFQTMSTYGTGASGGPTTSGVGGAGGNSSSSSSSATGTGGNTPDAG